MREIRTQKLLVQLWKTGPALFWLLALSGCSSMTPQQCLTADWYLEGYAAGLDGKSPVAFTSINNGCNLHGIHIDKHRFVYGWIAAQHSRSPGDTLIADTGRNGAAQSTSDRNDHSSTTAVSAPSGR